MHVIFEGVLNRETCLLILAFINNKNYFTLSFLNERIANFPYGRTEKRNKPPRPITLANLSGSKLRLSGKILRKLLLMCMYVRMYSFRNVELFHFASSHNWR